MHHILPLFIGGTDVGVSADSSLLGICQATRRSPKAIREAGGVGDNSSPVYRGGVQRKEGFQNNKQQLFNLYPLYLSI